MKRKIIRIDEEKCNGCGLCVNACAEGAIQLVDGKARLLSETYCDGLGACIGECPQDAITIEEREAEAFDEAAVKKHLASAGNSASPKPQAHAHQHHHGGGGCPGSMARSLTARKGAGSAGSSGLGTPSELRQWPVQLHLVPINAAYWEDADLLIAADCVAFASGDFHPRLLKGKKLIIACPKLDDTDSYVEKLQEIFSSNNIRSITVARMEVPCCGGLVAIAKQALEKSGKKIPFSTVIMGIDGEIRAEEGMDGLMMNV